jgi:hypothetical protein
VVSRSTGDSERVPVEEAVTHVQALLAKATA